MEVMEKRRHVVPTAGLRRDSVRRECTVQTPAESLYRGLRAWIWEFLEHSRLIILSLVFVAIATYSDYRCGVYVASTRGVQVPDLILNQLGPIDLSPLFVYGYASLLATMFLYPLLFRVRTLHVVACQFSLLLVVRSLFMIVTHLETPAGSIAVSFPWLFRYLCFENDMFFSGHTAMPFLGFYLFRDSALRYVFLAGAIVMGITVLAMHMHYSIDVFSAFFITYASYRMGNWILRKVTPGSARQPTP